MGRLCPLDVALFGFGITPHVFFFKKHLDPDQLMAGLSATLEHFPMFAGHLGVCARAGQQYSAAATS